jgi:hypothetical protein
MGFATFPVCRRVAASSPLSRWRRPFEAFPSLAASPRRRGSFPLAVAREVPGVFPARVATFASHSAFPGRSTSGLCSAKESVASVPVLPPGAARCSLGLSSLQCRVVPSCAPAEAFAPRARQPKPSGAALFGGQGQGRVSRRSLRRVLHPSTPPLRSVSSSRGRRACAHGSAAAGCLRPKAAVRDRRGSPRWFVLSPEGVRRGQRGSPAPCVPRRGREVPTMTLLARCRSEEWSASFSAPFSLRPRGLAAAGPGPKTSSRFGSLSRSGGRPLAIWVSLRREPPS